MTKPMMASLIFIITSLSALVVITGIAQMTPWRQPEPLSPVLEGGAKEPNGKTQTNVDPTYRAITQRPLFWPSRRPVPPKPEEKPQPLPVDFLKGAELIGTFTSQDAKGAILRLAKKGKVIRIAEGETVDGITLRAVNSVSAQFSDGLGRTQTLMLTYAKQGNAPTIPSRENGVKESASQAPVQNATQQNPPVELPWVPVTPPQKR